MTARGRAPNYRLKVDVMSAGNVLLEAGSFVRPVEDRYLPDHMKDDMKEQRLFFGDKVVSCYTAKGFVLVNRDQLEEC